MRILAKLIVILSIQAFAASYINPVQGQRDSPDPGAIFYNGYYYAVTTMGWDGKYFPIWKSSDATNFTQVGWAMPTAPSWTACCDYWAPQIHLINGHFLLYYTARDKNRKMLSIGSATATNILGPYVDKGEPIVTNSSEGVIDATVLVDGTAYYLVYKVDGNAHGHQTQFWAVLLDPTGMGTRGSPVFLLKNDQNWENGIIEGQWFIKYANYFYLFYSGCGYNNDCYAVGVARSTNALGPYIKYYGNPILHTRSPMTAQSWEGPGHCSVVKTPYNRYLMIYHAWPHGGLNTKRVMLMDQIFFTTEWPSLHDPYPSQTWQPSPMVLNLQS